MYSRVKNTFMSLDLKTQQRQFNSHAFFLPLFGALTAISVTTKPAQAIDVDLGEKNAPNEIVTLDKLRTLTVGERKAFERAKTILRPISKSDFTKIIADLDNIMNGSAKLTNQDCLTLLIAREWLNRESPRFFLVEDRYLGVNNPYTSLAKQPLRDGRVISTVMNNSANQSCVRGLLDALWYNFTFPNHTEAKPLDLWNDGSNSQKPNPPTALQQKTSPAQPNLEKQGNYPKMSLTQGEVLAKDLKYTFVTNAWAFGMELTEEAQALVAEIIALGNSGNAKPYKTGNGFQSYIVDMNRTIGTTKENGVQVPTSLVKIIAKNGEIVQIVLLEGTKTPQQPRQDQVEAQGQGVSQSSLISPSASQVKTPTAPTQSNIEQTNFERSKRIAYEHFVSSGIMQSRTKDRQYGLLLRFKYASENGLGKNSQLESITPNSQNTGYPQDMMLPSSDASKQGQVGETIAKKLEFGQIATSDDTLIRVGDNQFITDNSRDYQGNFVEGWQSRFNKQLDSSVAFARSQVELTDQEASDLRMKLSIMIGTIWLEEDAKIRTQLQTGAGVIAYFGDYIPRNKREVALEKQQIQNFLITTGEIGAGIATDVTIDLIAGGGTFASGGTATAPAIQFSIIAGSTSGYTISQTAEWLRIVSERQAGIQISDEKATERMRNAGQSGFVAGTLPFAIGYAGKKFIATPQAQKIVLRETTEQVAKSVAKQGLEQIADVQLRETLESWAKQGSDLGWIRNNPNAKIWQLKNSPSKKELKAIKILQENGYEFVGIAEVNNLGKKGVGTFDGLIRKNGEVLAVELKSVNFTLRATKRAFEYILTQCEGQGAITKTCVGNMMFDSSGIFNLRQFKEFISDFDGKAKKQALEYLHSIQIIDEKGVMKSYKFEDLLK